MPVVGIKTETWKMIFRIIFIIVLVAMYVTDRGYGLWKIPPSREEYLIILSFALGLDFDTIRTIVIRLLVPSYGSDKDKKDEAVMNQIKSDVSKKGRHNDNDINT